MNETNKHIYAVKRLVKTDIQEGNYEINIQNEAKCLKHLRGSDAYIH